jgi:hypothetical protein
LIPEFDVNLRGCDNEVFGCPGNLNHHISAKLISHVTYLLLVGSCRPAAITNLL